MARARAWTAWPAAVVVAVAVTMLAASATASVEIRDSETTALLQEFEKAQCRGQEGKEPVRRLLAARQRPLHAAVCTCRRRSGPASATTYDIFYGSGPVDLDVFGPGPGERYSNEFGIPGTPPGTVGAGGIKVSQNGKRFSIGVYALNDASFTKGVSISGSAKCQYPLPALSAQPLGRLRLRRDWRRRSGGEADEAEDQVEDVVLVVDGNQPDQDAVGLDEPPDRQHQIDEADAEAVGAGAGDRAGDRQRRAGRARCGRGCASR